MLIKDPEIEQEIPIEWRNTIYRINEAILSKNLEDLVDRTDSIKADTNTILSIYSSIIEYDFTLCRLSDATWKTSKCRWMKKYWHVMVDLSTLEEGLSDLGLFMSVFETGNKWVFSVESVHVA